MADRIARMWNGSSWEVITSTAAAPTAVANYQSASPSGPVTGQVWVDSDDNSIYVYTGSAWVSSSSSSGPNIIGIACSDETTSLTIGTGKTTFRMPYAMTLSEVRATVTTAPTGSTLIVDINEDGVSILSTKLSIDAGEKSSVTAATPVVISDTALADDAEITIDIDQVGATVPGSGLKIWFIGA